MTSATALFARTLHRPPATRCILSGELDSRPAGDPETTFVLYMCAYAGDVLRGELPSPYTDQRAREYARAALIPEELLERPCPDPQRTSIALRIPLWELTAAAPAHGGEGRDEPDRVRTRGDFAW